MKHLYNEDNGLYIADRTVSLRYHQFRTQRKDLKELVLNNHKTHLLSEAELQKYLKCSIGDNDEYLSKMKDKILKDKIYVDAEGFSIEIARKLGNNYIGNNCILVSTKQEECGSIRDNCSSKHSKNGLIRKIFDVHRNIIGQILMGEALVGTEKQIDVDKSINTDIIIDNPDSLFSIEMVFDTPNNALYKLRNIRKNERILSETEGKLKDRVFLKNLLHNIEDISADHGSLDRISDKEIRIKERMDFNKLRLDDIDIYCIKHGDTNVLVYFSDNDNDKKIFMDDDIIILNGKDMESLSVLIELGVVSYNPYLGFERAANMVLRHRKGRNEKIENLDIPERAKELLSSAELLIESNRDKDFFVNLDHTKICMTYPLIQNEILYELLTRMENDEYKSCYMNTEKFISTVSNMNDEQFGEFIEKILDSLEFVEENNTIVNMWLIQNKKDICNDLGIKFVQNV